MDENGCDHYLSQKYSLSIHIGLIVSSYKGMSANMTKEQQGTEIRFLIRADGRPTFLSKDAIFYKLQKIFGFTLSTMIGRTHYLPFTRQTVRFRAIHGGPQWDFVLGRPGKNCGDLQNLKNSMKQLAVWYRFSYTDFHHP